MTDNLLFGNNPLFGDDVEAIQEYLKLHPEQLNTNGNIDVDFMTPICYAAYNGLCDVVDFYLSVKAEVGSAMSFACSAGKIDVLLLLLKAGHLPNCDVLFHLCCATNPIPLFNVLLPYISDFNIGEETMMECAIRNKQKGLVEALIPFTDLPSVDYVKLAVRHWNPDVCQLLIDAGATVHPDIYHYVNKTAAIDFLIDHGYDVSWTDEDRNTALHIVCAPSEFGTNVNIVRKFIEVGVDVNAKNNEGDTFDWSLAPYERQELGI